MHRLRTLCWISLLNDGRVGVLKHSIGKVEKELMWSWPGLPAEKKYSHRLSIQGSLYHYLAKLFGLKNVLTLSIPTWKLVQ